MRLIPAGLMSVKSVGLLAEIGNSCIFLVISGNFNIIIAAIIYINHIAAFAKIGVNETIHYQMYPIVFKQSEASWKPV